MNKKQIQRIWKGWFSYMLKLIIGLKGSGKTKHLIELANKAVEVSPGNVVCIEKSNKRIFDVNLYGIINRSLYRAVKTDPDNVLFFRVALRVDSRLDKALRIHSFKVFSEFVCREFDRFGAAYSSNNDIHKFLPL